MSCTRCDSWQVTRQIAWRRTPPASTVNSKLRYKYEISKHLNIFSGLCFDWFDHHQLRCDKLHLHKKGLFPAFQRQEHRKSEINWEKINGWKKLLPLHVLPQRQHFAESLRWLQFAMTKRHCLFELNTFPARTTKKNYNHISALSIANSRTAPESSRNSME